MDTLILFEVFDKSMTNLFRVMVMVPLELWLELMLVLCLRL